MPNSKTNGKGQRPAWNEASLSQMPALHLLRNMGWTYLPPDEIRELRRKSSQKTILEPVLREWLFNNNTTLERRPLNARSITLAIEKIDDRRGDAADMHALLVHGESVEQYEDGRAEHPQVKYIDWRNPARNVFNVTIEFRVNNLDTEKTKRPDIALFVNGIPLAAMECKDPSIRSPLDDAIEQMREYQKKKFIAPLFDTSFLLLALAGGHAAYGAPGTPAEHWTRFRRESNKAEFEANEDEVRQLINTPIPRKDYVLMFGEARSKALEVEHPDWYQPKRLPKEQDHLLFKMCRPEPFLDLLRNSIVIDSARHSSIKVARPHQLRAVDKSLTRLQEFEDGRRRGGLVWHQQGSGKSMTMVLLVQKLLLNNFILNCKIIVVTDRIELDAQIKSTFQQSQINRKIDRAKDSKHLAGKLVDNSSDIVTTLIHKFDQALEILNEQGTANDSADILVLIDEGHRTQYGELSAAMLSCLPNACFIAFTGTPVVKADKNTINKFGGIIDAYSIADAEADKVIVPLRYEGRMVAHCLQHDNLDEWFENAGRYLSDAQIEQLKRSFARTSKVQKTRETVRAVAMDIALHFTQFIAPSKLKGQVVTADKQTAVRYLRALEEANESGILPRTFTCRLLISPVNEREGDDDGKEQTPKQDVIDFWEEMMQQYGSPANYDEQVRSAFKHDDDPQLIITVDKLLTGFDAPRNTVLYLTRKLEGHTLLQAVARVNRRCGAKEHGLVLDYVGVLNKLNSAREVYSQLLSDYDSNDLQGVITDLADIGEVVRADRDAVARIFDSLNSQGLERDDEACRRILFDEARRDDFYRKVRAFTDSYNLALSSEQFVRQSSHELRQEFKADLTFYSKLARYIRTYYADENRVGQSVHNELFQLMDQNVGVAGLEQIVAPVDLSDADAVRAAIEQGVDAGAASERFALLTKRHIEEKMRGNPRFYKQFSDMLQEALDDYHSRRIDEAELFRRTEETKRQAEESEDVDTPPSVRTTRCGSAVYYSLNTLLAAEGQDVETGTIVQATLLIDAILKSETTVDWELNDEVQRDIRAKIENELDDSELFFDEAEHLTTFLDECLMIAHAVYGSD